MSAVNHMASVVCGHTKTHKFTDALLLSKSWKFECVCLTGMAIVFYLLALVCVVFHMNANHIASLRL